MEVKREFKTLQILWVPGAQVRTGTISIDIRKYFDPAPVRIAKVWLQSHYTDVTAGASEQQADARLRIDDVRAMEMPTMQITPSSGTAITAQRPAVPSGGGGYDFLEDIFLNTPVFEIEVSGFKRQAGGYPAAYTFTFDIVIQFEFKTPLL